VVLDYIFDDKSHILKVILISFPKSNKFFFELFQLKINF